MISSCSGEPSNAILTHAITTKGTDPQKVSAASQRPGESCLTFHLDIHYKTSNVFIKNNGQCLFFVVPWAVLWFLLYALMCKPLISEHVFHTGLFISETNLHLGLALVYNKQNSKKATTPFRDVRLGGRKGL